MHLIHSSRSIFRKSITLFLNLELFIIEFKDKAIIFFSLILPCILLDIALTVVVN